MVSTSYPKNLQDWNGRFIYNLAEALARQPDLRLRLWSPPGSLPVAVSSAATPNESQWLQALSSQGGIAHLLRQGSIQSLRWSLSLIWHLNQTYRREQQCDLVHVNWLQNSIPLLGTQKPLVVSVLGSDMGLLRFPGITLLLRYVFRHRKTIISPNAEWMIAPLHEKFGDVAEIHVISFGVDPIWFDVTRTPVEPALWIAVTRVTKEKIGTLFKWGEGLFTKQRQLHLFGPMQESLALPPWILYHGPTHPMDLAQNWFPKATGLITLSQHNEGRPQVMLEAMAAGLPIIASDLPAHRDLIKQRETGWLAHTKEETINGLEWLEQPESNSLVGLAAQRWVKNSVGTWDDCAARYTALYHRLLEQ
jgi:glycosyltransferase involved in cell wall biosynthesis